MQEILKEYLVLFNAITDAQHSLNLICEKLAFAQQSAEDLYISRDCDSLVKNECVSA